MISRILFGISDIIIHGSKWCENVGAGGLQAAVLGRTAWARLMGRPPHSPFLLLLLLQLMLSSPPLATDRRKS